MKAWADRTYRNKYSAQIENRVRKSPAFWTIQEYVAWKRAQEGPLVRLRNRFWRRLDDLAGNPDIFTMQVTVVQDTTNPAS